MAIVWILICCVLGIVFSIYPDGHVEVGQIIVPALFLFAAFILFLVRKNERIFDIVLYAFGKIVIFLPLLVLIGSVLYFSLTR